MTRRGWTATTVLLIAVALGVGWLALGRSARPSPPVSDTIERAHIDGTRLTSPWIEGPGLRDGDARMIAFRQAAEARIRAAQATDPSLRVSVYVRDLEEGVWTGIDENARFVPASLMKVAVLFHALTRLEADPRLANARTRYPGSDSMPSSDNLEGEPPPRHMTPGDSYTFVELLERMIARSDNHAKDLVLRGVDVSDIDSLMLRLGVPVTFDAEGEAVMTAQSYARLFRLLYHSSVFSRPTSEFALELLRRADYSDGLRAGLPSRVVVASKYGVHFQPRNRESAVQLHECGIVYAARNPFTLCVMTRSLTRTSASLAAVIADLANTAWRTVPYPRGSPGGVSAGG